MSYQNGGPRKLEEIGVSGMDLQRKKTFRRILFGTLGIIFVVTFAAMALVVHTHQTYGSTHSDGDSLVSESPISLDYLHLNTDVSIPSGCETTVLLIRHCEKEGDETIDNDGNEHCNYIGLERAYFIPSLFGTPGNGDHRWPVPTALFALTEDRSTNYNFREIETLLPLANKYGLKIDSDVKHNEALAKRIFKELAKGHWCGKTVLVSWKHEYLGALAQQLGCVDCPFDYPDAVFDEVWQLKYVYDVDGTSVVKLSHLLQPGSEPTTTSSNNSTRRTLKKRRTRRKTPAATSSSLKKWSVYSTVTHQNFDPLKFSFSSGDYISGSSSGNWLKGRDSVESSQGGDEM
jgi:hypothetical protein